MEKYKSKLVKIIPLFLILTLISIDFFLKDGLNSYIFYSGLTLSLFTSLVVINQNKTDYSKEKKKNTLITFTVVIVLTFLMTSYFILKQP